MRAIEPGDEVLVQGTVLDITNDGKICLAISRVFPKAVKVREGKDLTVVLEEREDPELIFSPHTRSSGETGLPGD